MSGTVKLVESCWWLESGKIIGHTSGIMISTFSSGSAFVWEGLLEKTNVFICSTAPIVKMLNVSHRNILNTTIMTIDNIIYIYTIIWEILNKKTYIFIYFSAETEFLVSSHLIFC